MSATYRPVSDRAKAIYGEDDFEAEFDAIEERDQLDGGHLEIVPRSYRVLSNNFTAAEQGEVVDLALPVENEAGLIQGGHIERAEKPVVAKKTSATKKAAAAKKTATANTEKKG